MDAPEKYHSHVTTRSVVPVICGYDRSLLTIKWIKASLYVAGLCTVACWVVGCWVHITGTGNLIILLPLGEFAREAILFVVSLILTFINDALGYVHTISLRWALYREGRLEWNTNLRLVTAARTSFANRWYMNALATAMLTLSYACASLLLIRSVDPFVFAETGETMPMAGVNAIAFMLLGTSICVQVVLAMLCLYEHDTQIPTWSASPLANTLTALYGHSAIEHRPGRCMMSVTDMHSPSEARLPAKKQPTLWTMRHVKWIVVFLWILCLISFTWAAAMIKVATDSPDYPPTTGFQFEWTSSTYAEIDFHMSPDNDWFEFAPATQLFLGLLFLSLVQGIQALGLHCVELLVNMSRDEVVWQNAGSIEGTLIGNEPFLAALTSWRTIALTLLKTALHWLLGQSLMSYCRMLSMPDIYNVTDNIIDYGSFNFIISPSRLLVFAVLSAITATFTTVLAFWQVRSPQPAAWGHLQTLADLVDDWRTVDRRLWWGDKKSADGNGVRHAGTSHNPDEVDRLDMEAYYAGEDKPLLIEACRAV